MPDVSGVKEALRAVAELKVLGSRFGRGGRCEDVYVAFRLGDDAVLIPDLPRDGRGRASDRRWLGVDIGKTCCCSRHQATDMANAMIHYKRQSRYVMGACCQMHDNDDALSDRAHRSMQDMVRCGKHYKMFQTARTVLRVTLQGQGEIMMSVGEKARRVTQVTARCRD